jgi:hypothetical protein
MLLITLSVLNYDLFDFFYLKFECLSYSKNYANYYIFCWDLLY